MRPAKAGHMRLDVLAQCSAPAAGLEDPQGAIPLASDLLVSFTSLDSTTAFFALVRLSGLGFLSAVKRSRVIVAEAFSAHLHLLGVLDRGDLDAP